MVDGAPKHLRHPQNEQKFVRFYLGFGVLESYLHTYFVVVVVLCYLNSNLLVKLQVEQYTLGHIRGISTYACITLLGWNALKFHWWSGHAHNHFLHYQRNAYSYILALAISQFQQVMKRNINIKAYDIVTLSFIALINSQSKTLRPLRGKIVSLEALGCSQHILLQQCQCGFLFSVLFVRLFMIIP